MTYLMKLEEKEQVIRELDRWTIFYEGRLIKGVRAIVIERKGDKKDEV